jgi:benzylsuccinate CoA-transferase BbsF subunit
MYPNVPFKMPASPPRPSIRAPLLGEHTDEICRELLGMSDKEITKLKEEGVLEDAGLLSARTARAKGRTPER